MAVIEVTDITHRYGKKKVLENLSFHLDEGKTLALLGKNGTGKSTTLNILGGFLTPESGSALIYGENTGQLSNKTKQRIAILQEGHVQYDFMTIAEIEKYYSTFYPKWDKQIYWKLISHLNLPKTKKLSTMSCGQRSQVALGLILAQHPDLMLLDDFSMGLDPGYRRLFVEVLKEYRTKYGTTILMTSHIIQDMEKLVDELIILDYKNIILQTSLEAFQTDFKHYRVHFSADIPNQASWQWPSSIKNVEITSKFTDIFTLGDKEEVASYINLHYTDKVEILSLPMTFEDAFIGITGKY